MRSKHRPSPTFSAPSMLGGLAALLLVVAGACGGADGDSSQQPLADNSIDTQIGGSDSPVTGTITIDGEEHHFQFGDVKFSNFDTGKAYYGGRCMALAGVRMMDGYAVDGDGEAIAHDDDEPISIKLSVPGPDLSNALLRDDPEAANLELNLELGDIGHRLLGEDDDVEPPTWTVDGGRITGSATVDGGWKDGVEADPFTVTFDIADCG